MRVVLGMLPCSHFLFEGRRSLRSLAHLHGAPEAGDDEEDVFEDDPGRVLHPAPIARDQHAVHRLRPEDPAQHVVERDDHRRRNQHAPVAVEREERERSEDMKVGLDSSAGQVNEQRAHQHLRDGDRVARRGLARSQNGEERREHADEAAEHDGRPDVQVDRADGAGPRQRRHPHREDDAGDPLKAHQPGKQPICAPVDIALVLVEERVGAARRSADWASADQASWRWLSRFRRPGCERADTRRRSFRALGAIRDSAGRPATAVPGCRPHARERR